MKRVSLVLIIAVLLNLCTAVSFASDGNILTNSTMDTLSGWTCSNGGAMTLDTSGNWNGSKGSSMQLIYSSGSYFEAVTKVTMEPGKKYLISFYAKASDENARLMPIRIHGNGWNYIPTQTLSTKWEYYTIEWTHPYENLQGTAVDGTGQLTLRLLDKSTVWIDDVKIVDIAYVPDEPDVINPDYYEPYDYNMPTGSQQIDTFDDISGHWAEDTLRILKTDGFITGLGDGTYQPDRNITRAEFLAMIVSQLEIEDAKYDNSFCDVKSGSWYSGIIQNAKELGLISPVLTTDGKFRPDEDITREDACVMAQTYADYRGVEAKNGGGVFADDAFISSYAKASVYRAYNSGIIKGYEDKTFCPKATLTRAEAAQILNNLVECDGRMSVYVDPENGNDTNYGSKTAPVKTFEQAQRIVQDENDDMRHNIYVLIKAGEHFINAPIELDAKDSGTNGYSVIYTTYGDGQAVLSGGRHIDTDWVIDDAEKGIYKTFVGTDIKTRQMFVNGIRMVRARTVSGFRSESSKINEDESGYISEDTYFADYRDISDMELVYYQEWTNPRCGVEKLIKNDDGTVTLRMENPCWNYLMNKEHLKISNPKWFENQYEFIDEEGEWYLDRNGWLYYKPFSFIDLDSADVVLPVTERLLNVTGSKTERVENIAFVNLGFKYATWMRPSTGNGYTDAQGGRIRENGDRVPDSAVWIKYTKNVSVADCTFSKLGLTALNVTDWVEDVKIKGNHIYDISGCGMYVGNHGVDDGASGEGYLCKNIEIKNNLVHDYGVDYGSSDGIECMTMSYATVSHNEIYNARYSGLVMGYGSSGSRYAIDFTHNYVHDVLNEQIFDGGSIYVTSRTTGTEERYNNIAYNYLANQGNWSGVIYPDNYSSYWDIHHNVVDQTRKPLWYKDGNWNVTEAIWMFSNGLEKNLLHENYSTSNRHRVTNYAAPPEQVMEIGENYYYPNADWPEEALDIINNAGLESEYAQRYQTGIEVVDLTDTSISLMDAEEINIKDYLVAYGRKDEKMDISQLDFAFAADRPDIIEVSDDGRVKSIGRGEANLTVTIVNNGILYTKNVEIYAGDSFDRVDFEKDEIMLYEGTSITLAPSTISSLGTVLAVDSISYSCADEAVAVVDETGIITATGAGETTLKATVEYRGSSYDTRIPVTVKKMVSSDDEFDVNNYLVKNLDKELSSPDFWKAGLAGDSVVSTQNGIAFSTPANTVGSANSYYNELLHTKIQINADGGWPSICLRVKNRDETYTLNTLYMITFGQGNINNIQKFVRGQRKILVGTGASCDFEYGKEYDLMVGAINHEDCVELIVCIDGVPYVRAYDYDDDRITEEGYVQMYCRSGNIVLSKTEE